MRRSRKERGRSDDYNKIVEKQQGIERKIGSDSAQQGSQSSDFLERMQNKKIFEMDTLNIRNIMEQSKGLFKIEPKVKASDTYSLSLIYTPGVGQNCMAIKEKPDAVYDYCITGHAQVLVTDGSGAPIPIKHTNELIPRLELATVFTKFFYNVDSYPLILDPKLTQTDEDWIDAIENLITTYKVITLIMVSEERLATLIPKLNAKNLPCSIFTQQVFSPVRDELKQRKVEKDQAGLDAFLFENALVRAVLDYRAYLKPDELLKVAEAEWGKTKNLFTTLPNNLVDTLLAAYSGIVKHLKDHNLVHDTMKHVQPEALIEKMVKYYMFGDAAFLNPWGNGHYLEQNTTAQNSLVLHQRYQGMIYIKPTFAPTSLEEVFRLILRSFKQNNLDTLQLEIQANPDLAYKVTSLYNYCSIITNGTAILGYGDIGPAAGMPVMEGKSVLFKCLAGIDVMPICLKEKNPQKVIKLVRQMAPIFSAINLEDIKAPECFEVETQCIQSLPIPVMHDDQHGTAVVCLAAIINGLKLMKKKPEEVKLIINGAGAAGLAICELLLGLGIKNTIICDTSGAIFVGRPKNMNPYKNKLANITNPNKEEGALTQVIKNADMFVGVSVAGALTQEMVKSMNPKPFVLALANPTPEIMPEEAKAAGAYIVATGRSDFKNQVNNSLAFPGIFRGAIATKASKINLEMKLAAAHAIADLVQERDLNPEYIMPPALSADIPAVVAKAVADAARRSGVARDQHFTPSQVHDFTRKLNIDGLLPIVQ